MTRVYAYLAVALVAGLLGGMGLFVYFGKANDPFAPCRTSVVSGGAAAIGGPFELVDKNGKTVTDKEVLAKPSLVYFGYTFCPDVCPTDNARNAEAVDLAAASGYDVTPVFVTIDPGRDTPEVVGEFAGYMHEKMIGLTGSPEQIKTAASAYKVYFRKTSDDEDYLVDHSTFTYLVLPGHGFVEFFRRDDTAEGIAKTLACFIDRA